MATTILGPRHKDPRELHWTSPANNRGMSIDTGKRCQAQLEARLVCHAIFPFGHEFQGRSCLFCKGPLSGKVPEHPLILFIVLEFLFIGAGSKYANKYATISYS